MTQYVIDADGVIDTQIITISINNNLTITINNTLIMTSLVNFHLVQGKSIQVSV